MSVESTTTIAGLNALWPQGTDVKAEGDDHLRLIKSVLKADALDQADLTAINAAIASKPASTAQARNRIVNGAMQVSQETGNTALGPTGAMNSHAADQWLGASTTTGTTTQQRVQVVTPNGSVNRIRLTVNTADTSLATGEFQLLMQIIEGIRIADFRYGTAQAKQAILRFGFKGPAGTYSAAIRNGSNRSYIANFTVSAGQANADTEQTIVIPGDTIGTWAVDTSAGMNVTIGIAAGATYQGVAGWQAGNLFSIAGNTNGLATAGAVYELFDVGLYLDPNATGVPPPWQMPDEAQELAACQRYYQRFNWHGFASATAANQYSGHTVGFAEVMRQAPALATSGGTAVNVVASGLDNGSTSSCRGYIQAIAAGTFSLTSAVGTANARM